MARGMGGHTGLHPHFNRFNEQPEPPPGARRRGHSHEQNRLVQLTEGTAACAHLGTCVHGEGGDSVLLCVCAHGESR